MKNEKIIRSIDTILQVLVILSLVMNAFFILCVAICEILGTPKFEQILSAIGLTISNSTMIAIGMGNVIIMLCLVAIDGKLQKKLQNPGADNSR